MVTKVRKKGRRRKGERKQRTSNPNEHLRRSVMECCRTSFTSFHPTTDPLTHPPTRSYLHISPATYSTDITLATHSSQPLHVTQSPSNPRKKLLKHTFTSPSLPLSTRNNNPSENANLSQDYHLHPSLPQQAPKQPYYHPICHIHGHSHLLHLTLSFAPALTHITEEVLPIRND